MTRQRLVAFVLVISAAGVLSLAAHRSGYAIAISAIALLGVPGWVQVSISRPRKVILILLMAAAFAAQWNISPGTDSQATDIFFPLGNLAGQFLLAMMTLEFFLRRDRGLPPTLPLLGCLAIISAGAYRMLAGVLTENQAFQGLTLVHMTATALFYVASRPHFTAGCRDRPDRHAVMACLLMGGVGMAWIAGNLVRDNAYELGRLLWIRLAPSGNRRIGFAEAGRLTSVNLLRAGQDRTVLWVESPRPGGYLRGAAFERFGESAWSTGLTSRRLTQAPTPPPPLAQAGEGEYLYVTGQVRPPGWQMTVHPHSSLPVHVFAPLESQAFYAPVANAAMSDHRTATSPDLAGGLGYKVWVADTPAAEAPDDDILRRCLELPPKLDDRVKELAGRIFQGCTSARQKMAAVTAYLIGHCRYSLSISVPSGRDPLSYFLLEAKAAHCEYFASSAAVLLRAGGVPSRYVTGFVAERFNPVGGYWYARNGDAHAWAEAWDDAAGRWVTVEATPPDGLPGRDARGWLAHVWDFLVFRIQQLREAVATQGWKGLAGWLLALAGDVLGLLVNTWPGRVLAAVGLVLLARRWRRTWRRRARSRPVGPEVHQWRRLLARMDKRLARRGLVRRPAETLHQFAQRIADSQPGAGGDGAELVLLAQWYVRAARVRYRSEIGAQELGQLRAELPSKGRQ